MCVRDMVFNELICSCYWHWLVLAKNLMLQIWFSKLAKSKTWSLKYPHGTQEYIFLHGDPGRESCVVVAYYRGGRVLSVHRCDNVVLKQTIQAQRTCTA